MHLKFLEIEKQSSSDEVGKVTFTASTNTPDRYGDIVEQRGWSIKAYERNPIILLNHDHSSLPIGKGDIRFSEGNLIVDVTFDMEDPQAANVARKAANGFINAVSVGFQPIESVSRRDLPDNSPFYGKRGQYFKKAELLEISIVTIPANSEATMLGKNTGLLLDSQLGRLIKEIVQSEIQSQTVNKHILKVEEDEETVVITYAKKEKMEDKDDLEEAYLDDDEDTEDAMSYHKDEEEEDSEDDKKKDYLDYISSYIATII